MRPLSSQVRIYVAQMKAAWNIFHVKKKHIDAQKKAVQYKYLIGE